MSRTPYKSFIASNTAMISLAAILFGGGVLVSLYAANFQWLSRFGALLVCVGIILIARPAVIGEPIRTEVFDDETGFSDTNPLHYEKKGTTTPEWVMEDVRSQRAVYCYGPAVCFIGTATNGFGDLLNRFFGF